MPKKIKLSDIIKEQERQETMDSMERLAGLLEKILNKENLKFLELKIPTVQKVEVTNQIPEFKAPEVQKVEILNPIKEVELKKPSWWQNISQSPLFVFIRWFKLRLCLENCRCTICFSGQYLFFCWEFCSARPHGIFLTNYSGF